MKMKLRLLFLMTMAVMANRAIAQDPQRPNVLFIIADDLTANAVSCYGNPLNITPNIDQLAAEGIRYERAYCQFPVCGPSRASFMSGYYPHATETFGYTSGRENIGPEKVTWSQLFKNEGYYTARVSKIFHMGVPGDIEKGSNGADDAASWQERFNSQGPEWKAEGAAELVQNNPYNALERKGGNVMTIVKASGDDGVHADGKTAEKASALIRKHKDSPFFLAVGLVRPHVPFVAPASYFEAFPYREMVLPPKVIGDWDDIPASGINYVTTVNAEMSEDQEKKAISGYYAAVSYMDAQVGKVLKTLKNEGLEDNTIVIFTSDHGFHLGEHEFWMKVSLHEESAKVPLIIKVPGKSPAVCRSFAELIDLYPTVAELAGLELPNEIQGKSLVNTLDDPTFEVRDMAFSVSKYRGVEAFLLRNDRWAFIQYGEEGEGGMELFDMVNDPQQFNNLAKNPQYAAQVDMFQQRLKQKLVAVRDNDLGKSYGMGDL
ncbi:sulfatase [Echinicola vietnamensis]|uniref:Arylsulfatase A family protein n=1 Tax=Echinicola vietnamensis (strain DSM 17526 / LMG 23754 / KMM 6221) TaxID=926556 RepID=L0G2Y6_ECHVK|nr:sulfatase [Echinicola vietnamensis]AGA79902.1 arylsulfatase A family protein [Echinicola vietnamensis DSM 17526]